MKISGKFTYTMIILSSSFSYFGNLQGFFLMDQAWKKENLGSVSDGEYFWTPI